MTIRKLGLLAVTAAMMTATGNAAYPTPWNQYEANPLEITLDIPPPQESEGGILASDLDNDGIPDFIVTTAGHIAAYANNGNKLWSRAEDLRIGGSSERVGLPGHNAPGVAVGDIDADGRRDALYFTNDGVFHVVDGSTGESIWTAKPPVPDGTERWEHLAIACFRGKGDSDILLQATNREGYRTGKYLAAYALDQLREGNYEPLWTRDDYWACAHNGVRLADLDGDGRDEICGPMLLDHEGRTTFSIPMRGHADSVFMQDVLPERPGIEVVVLEEGGGNRVFLFSKTALIWETDYKNWEPQNAAVGIFRADDPRMQIWCRSRFNTSQKPFVFDADAKLITQYEMDKVAPKGWTNSGVEIIWTIDWTGGPVQLAAAKERHTSGKVALFDPISGQFTKIWDEKADRLYVADVSGDWREEVIVLRGNTLAIYHNDEPNLDPGKPRLWERPHYRRAKQAYNYYSP